MIVKSGFYKEIPYTVKAIIYQNQYEVHHYCGYAHFQRNLLINSDEIDVHGGITFEERKNGEYTIGFDCAHLGDYLHDWPMEAVEEETKRMIDSVLALEEALIDYIG